MQHFQGNTLDSCMIDYREKEASVLAQLRTDMARLNGYPYRINVAETGLVCMWRSKRDRGTLPLSMSEVDRTPEGNAAMYPFSPRQHMLFPGRKIAFG
jgi:hypothetical protein